MQILIFLWKWNDCFIELTLIKHCWVIISMNDLDRPCSPQINCFVGMTADPKTSWWALHKLWLKALSCSRLSTVFLIMDSLAAFIISKFAQKSSILDILHFFFKFPLPLYLYATFLMTINYGCWNELKNLIAYFFWEGLSGWDK